MKSALGLYYAICSYYFVVIINEMYRYCGNVKLDAAGRVENQSLLCRITA